MKTAVFIDDDGEAQFVLTPESDVDKLVLRAIPGVRLGPQDPPRACKATLYTGQFYACMGGWTKQGTEHNSLIIRFEKED